MTDDIVARLRDNSGNDIYLCDDAADEIERLRSDNKHLERMWIDLINTCRTKSDRVVQLRAALDKIANGPRDADLSYLELYVELKLEARAALEGEKPND
jgi:hypothetical protein